MEKQDMKILSFEEASEKDMTFGDIMIHYKPDVTAEEAEEWFKDAFRDCMIKGISDNGNNIVRAIYYVSSKYINNDK